MARWCILGEFFKLQKLVVTMPKSHCPKVITSIDW